MNRCPNINDASYVELVSKIGSKDAAFRMWHRFESMFPGEGSAQALLSLKNTKPSDIEKSIVESSLNVVPPKKGEEHVYTLVSDGKVIPSITTVLSKVLNESQTRTPKEGYGKTGDNVHKISELIAKGKNQEALDFATTLNYPSKLYPALEKTINNLKKRGVVLSEQVLYTNKMPLEGNAHLASTADIILLTFDGKIEIYDFKTANNTAKSESENKSPWKYVAKNKGLRYGAQAMSYGRLVEWTTNMPVSDYFIIPIEIWNRDNDADNEIIDVNVIDPVNIKSIGSYEGALDLTDTLFKEVSKQHTVQGPTAIKDDSGNVYTKLTGDITGRYGSPEEIARHVKRGNRNGVTGYYTNNGTVFRPFKDQKNAEAQNQQIVEEFVNLSANVTSNIAFAVKNYLNTGKVESLDLDERQGSKLMAFLNLFVGRTDIEVTRLSDIDGFSDKTNWITIKDGKNIHLFYVGGEQLSSRFGTRLFSTTVFGKVLNKLDEASLITPLQNTLGDARKLEGTLIAAQLIKNNPGYKIGESAVFSVRGSDSYGSYIDINLNLKTISQIMESPYMRERLLSENMISLFSDKKLLDYKEYRTDWIDVVRGFVSKNGSKLNYKLKDRLFSPITELTDRKALIEMLRETVNNKIGMGKNLNVDTETYLLSNLLLYLEDIEVSYLPEDLIGAATSMPQNKSNALLQEVNARLNYAASELSVKFRTDYKERFKKALEAFLSARNPLEKVSDILSGDVSRHYEHLFRKAKKKMMTETGEVETDVILFEFLDETDSAYNALEDHDKKFISEVNSIIESFTKSKGIEWEKGKLPLVRASFGNKVFRALRNKRGSAMDQMVNSYITDLKSDYGSGENSELSKTNPYISQTGPNGNIVRDDLLGFGIDGSVNWDSYSQWSTNIESVLDMFVIQGLRWEVLSEVGIVAKAANAIFNWHKSQLMEERLAPNIEFLNDFYTVNVLQRDVDANNPLNTGVKLVQRISTSAYIGFSIKSAIATSIGANLTIFSQAIANSLIRSGQFDLESITKAKAIMLQAFAFKGAKKISGVGDATTYDKISLLMLKFRLFNEDLNSLLNGYHRLGDKFLFRGKVLFAMMNGMDWESRASLMVAQLIKDGTWDAFSVNENLELVYDESKDRRLNGTAKGFNEEKSIALRRYLKDNVGENDIGALEFAYDVKMTNSLKGLADYLLGGMDREAKAMYNFRWWGRLFGALKSWMPAKVDRWVKGKFDSKMIGHVDFERKDGELVPVWKGDQLEGILVSLLAGMNNIKKAIRHQETEPLTEYQKTNLIRATGDLVLAGTALMFAQAIKDMDDEDDKDSVASKLFYESLFNGSQDLLVMFSFLKSGVEKPIPLEYLYSISDTMFSNITGGFRAEELMKLVPLARQVEYFDVLDLDNEQ